MDIILYFIDFFIHLDKHLPLIVESFGIWAYVIVFVVIFCETGLVVTPVLPGDSLLFALGTLAALDALHIEVLLPLLCLAAVAGDSVNYAVGHYIGPRVFHYDESRFFKKKYLLQDINISVNAGEMILILGGSGAGKTTFINAVMGYEKAVGKIVYNNTDVYEDYSKMKYERFLVSQI